jgi:hypothetical protein
MRLQMATSKGTVGKAVGRSWCCRLRQPPQAAARRAGLEGMRKVSTSRLQFGVLCQHGAQRLQCLQQVALVGLGKLGQQLGQGGALLRQQLTREAFLCRGEPHQDGTPVVGMGQALDQPVALHRVDQSLLGPVAPIGVAALVTTSPWEPWL